MRTNRLTTLHLPPTIPLLNQKPPNLHSKMNIQLTSRLITPIQVQITLPQTTRNISHLTFSSPRPGVYINSDVIRDVVGAAG